MQTGKPIIVHMPIDSVESLEEAKLPPGAARAIVRVIANHVTEAVSHLATKDDLRLNTAALQHEMSKLATSDELTAGLEDAKRYTLLLIQATRGEIRQIREEMATKGDLQRLATATKRDLQRLEMATNRALQQVQRTLSKQIATLRAPERKKL